MYQLLATHMQVTDYLGTSRENVSQRIDMAGLNAAQVELTIFEDPGGAFVQVDLDQSNDGENWSSVGSRGPFGLGYNLLQAFTGLKGRYVRVRLYLTDFGNPTVVAFGINRSRQ